MIGLEIMQGYDLIQGTWLLWTLVDSHVTRISTWLIIVGYEVLLFDDRSKAHQNDHSDLATR